MFGAPPKLPVPPENPGHLQGREPSWSVSAVIKYRHHCWKVLWGFITSKDCEILSPERLNSPHLNTSHKLNSFSKRSDWVSLFHWFPLTSAKLSASKATMACTDKGSCSSQDFLLSLWLQAQNADGGFRKTRATIRGRLHFLFNFVWSWDTPFICVFFQIKGRQSPTAKITWVMRGCGSAL